IKPYPPPLGTPACLSLHGRIKTIKVPKLSTAGALQVRPYNGLFHAGKAHQSLSPANSICEKTSPRRASTPSE
ncbi:hypothetical protein BGX23_007867, partial [Mortierella sp. AD031]